MPSVVICDDHRLFGESLRVVLQVAGYDVRACTQDPEEGAAAVQRHRPDVYLVDLRFGATDGLSGMRAALKSSPGTRSLVLTGFADVEAATSARAAGAAGLVGKDRPIEEILNAINEVAAGRSAFFDPRRGMVAPAPAADSAAESLVKYLTAREREVLDRLVQGQDTASLAREMGVTYSTARTHIQNLLTKLGVHSKLQAVALVTAHARS